VTNDLNNDSQVTPDKSPMSHQLDASMSPQTVFAKLDAVVQQLIIACQTLYHGSWDDCAEDIRRRQAGQPYLYRLKINVDDVLGWLYSLKKYEQTRGERFANLSDTNAENNAQAVKDPH
jgi:hypothetical protein